MREPYNGEEKRHPEGWHLKKDIHTGHILTTLMLLLTLVVMFNSMDKRVNENSIVNARQDREQAEYSKSIADVLNVIRLDVREIRSVVVAPKSSGHGG